MSEAEEAQVDSVTTIDTEKRAVSPEWMLQGVLSRIGETVDKLTGRGPRRASSLATSGIIDRLKHLMDSEVRDLGEKGRYVPNNITLKMQWDKFASDNEIQIDKLKNEILTAAVDHINDQRLFTFAPLNLEIKQDYFTDGIVISVSYDLFDNTTTDQEAEHNVTLPDVKVTDLFPYGDVPIIQESVDRSVKTEIILTGETKTFDFVPQMRLIVGRTKENGLVLADNSVSKSHASLAFNNDGDFIVADIGSTNGTFINDERIAYGKAIKINNGDIVKFGNIEIKFNPYEIVQHEKELGHIPAPTEHLNLTDSSIDRNSAKTFVENTADSDEWDKNI